MLWRIYLMDSNIDMLREAVKRALQFPANWAPALLEGTVTSIKDPLELGRAKVLLDHFTGPDGTGFETDWLYPLELKLWGLLPKNLIGQKVLCHTVNHSYEDMRVSLGVKPLYYRPVSYTNIRAQQTGCAIWFCVVGLL
jgi:hypothetical protein